MEIQINQLSSAYQGQRCLDDITLHIPSGHIFAVVGPNGCGKTTLLKHISGVLQSDNSARAIQLNLQELGSFSTRELAQKIGAVEQHISTGFDFSVRDVVALGRIPHLSRWQRSGPQDKERVEQAIQATRITHLANRSLFALSSGERQRVWLAMALAQEPQVLLLDEPTSHLDLQYQIDMFAILQQLAAEGMTIVVAIHDMNLTLLFAQQVALMSQGQVIATGAPSEILSTENIQRVFGVRMRPVHDETSGRLAGLLPLPPMSQPSGEGTPSLSKSNIGKNE